MCANKNKRFFVSRAFVSEEDFQSLIDLMRANKNTQFFASCAFASEEDFQSLIDLCTLTKVRDLESLKVN